MKCADGVSAVNVVFNDSIKRWMGRTDRRRPAFASTACIIVIIPKTSPRRSSSPDFDRGHRRRSDSGGLAPVDRTPRAGAPGAVPQPDPAGRGPGAWRLVCPEGAGARTPADARRPSAPVPGRSVVGDSQPVGLVAHAASSVPLNRNTTMSDTDGCLRRTELDRSTFPEFRERIARADHRKSRDRDPGLGVIRVIPDGRWNACGPVGGSPAWRPYWRRVDARRP